MMSNLLQSVLSSRLANATLGSSNESSTDNDTESKEGLNEWEQVDTDDELITVRSNPATASATPLEPRRPASPTRANSSSRLAVVETDTTDC